MASTGEACCWTACRRTACRCTARTQAVRQSGSRSNDRMQAIAWSDFGKFELRIGGIIAAEPFAQARKHACVLRVDVAVASSVCAIRVCRLLGSIRRRSWSAGWRWQCSTSLPGRSFRDVRMPGHQFPRRKRPGRVVCRRPRRTRGQKTAVSVVGACALPPAPCLRQAGCGAVGNHDQAIVDGVASFCV